ncbi:BCCT family transporter [Berryella wangjianweii]|nr:BCCT family transporter [Berryella wangjianweii]
MRDLSAMHTPDRNQDLTSGLASSEPEAPAPDPNDSTGKKRRITAVFWIALGIMGLLLGLSIALPEQFARVTKGATSLITTQLGWYYLLLVSIIVIVCTLIAASPMGRVPLGDHGESPRFSRGSWIAMLFSAGMGIGLVFYGAAEPLILFASHTPNADPGTIAALRDAFQYSFFHWGISAWAVYGIVALAIAYFRFRKKERSLVSATLKPLIGDKADGPIGSIVDAITAVATIIGVATSLGLGTIQINGGLNYLFGVPMSTEVQLIIIGVATVLYLGSAMSGLTKGVQFLSNANVVIAVILLAVIMVVGPTAQIMNVVTSTIGSYVQGFVNMSFDVAPFHEARHKWIESWTIFYWAWWIAWSPFVGVFIARISRGRTIREFLVCVLLVPTAFSCIWFAAFGSLSTNAQIAGANLASMPVDTMLFATLAEYPLGPILSVVALILIASFFVTSADSATFVLGMITENGSLTPRPTTKLVWGLLLSAIAAVLLLNGGLNALQDVLIICALPFSLIVVAMTVALVKELNHERRAMGLFFFPQALPTEDKPFRSYDDDEPETADLPEWVQTESDSQPGSGAADEQAAADAGTASTDEPRDARAPEPHQA